MPEPAAPSPEPSTVQPSTVQPRPSPNGRIPSPDTTVPPLPSEVTSAGWLHTSSLGKAMTPLRKMMRRTSRHP
jgi:hypothetical protein